MSRCPNCKSERSRPDVAARCVRRSLTTEYQYRRCTACDLVYLPDPGELGIDERVYISTYEDEWGETRDLKQRFEEYLVKRLPVDPPGRLLDVGCGTGSYLRFAEQRGWAVAGVDPWSHRYRPAIHPAVLPVDLQSAKFESGSFDVVTMWWVIEHYPDPVKTLAEVARILKPKTGLFVLSTDNIASIEARLFGRYWHHLLPPEHVCHFNPENLSALLARVGFRVRAVKHVPVTAGVMGSVHVYATEQGWPLTFGHPLWHILGLPFELFFGLLRKSGLFVVYCDLPETAESAQAAKAA
ncbi:MAG: class I SAM-dependent methyltransferase [Rhodospirillales bacterium]|nr:class I SAM-dependent methyltransferase [Rhodospirillales bacterium]